ncbi:MAG: M81 family metallopeptidase [Lachnospirales bacterium]
MKRILVASMHHESNSFNPIIAGEQDFNVIRGNDIFKAIRDNDSASGIITTLQDAGYEVIPTVFARAIPNGEVDYNFYNKIKNEIINMAIEAEKKAPIDAITLALHGSMRVKVQGEAEGYLLEDLRAIFPNIPIFSSLDMHATMTKRMHNNCNGFVGYKCAPHTDCTETGIHAAKMTIEALENGIETKSVWVKVPILIAGEQSSTTVEPMARLINALKKCEKEEGILATSYLMGFPWSDNEDSSAAVYVVANNIDLAKNKALELAQLIWSERNNFTFQTEAFPPKEALNVAFSALQDNKFPIYISDSGDNPTAGASSDCTDFLKLIMSDTRTNLLTKPIIYGGIYDPIATKECKNKVGEEITITFGSKFDKVTSTSITATGIVKAYIKDWSNSGTLKSDLALFNTQGVNIVLAERHVGYTTPKMFMDLGIDPNNVEIVVCKLGYLTHEQSLVAKKSILALTTGNTNEDLSTLDYKKVPRPIFPLDSDFPYQPIKNLFPREDL